MQDFCYNCGLVGHDLRKCHRERAVAVFDKSKPRYGPRLCAQPAKALAVLMAGLPPENTGNTNSRSTEEEGTGRSHSINADNTFHQSTNLESSLLASLTLNNPTTSYFQPITANSQPHNPNLSRPSHPSPIIRYEEDTACACHFESSPPLPP